MFGAQFISVHTPSKMNINPDNLSFLFQRIHSIESRRSFVFFFVTVWIMHLLFNVSPLLPAVSSRSCEKYVTVETFVSVAGWMWTVTGADVTSVNYDVYISVPMQSNVNPWIFFFLNASFSLAYAYLKIKIFIVHFKPELHRFLFDTVQIRTSSLQEMQRVSVYSAIKDLKTCSSLPRSSLAREETALRVLVVHVPPVRQHKGQVGQATLQQAPQVLSHKLVPLLWQVQPIAQVHWVILPSRRHMQRQITVRRLYLLLDFLKSMISACQVVWKLNEI